MTTTRVYGLLAGHGGMGLAFADNTLVKWRSFVAENALFGGRAALAPGAPIVWMYADRV